MNQVTQEGLDTENRIGNTVCSRTIANELRLLSGKNLANVLAAVQEAIDNEWLIVAIIDDYTTIHTNRRPTEQCLSNANTMCTLVWRIFKEISAIHVTSLSQLHNPNGIDAELLANELTSVSSMESIASTYASFMPCWIRNEFFDPESQRNRLMVHMYRQSDNVRKLRCLDNLHLVEFCFQQLKSKSNFETAVSFLEGSKIEKYMCKYAVLFPGDWPAQFYIRQIVYSNCKFEQYKSDAYNVLKERDSRNDCQLDHNYNMKNNSIDDTKTIPVENFYQTAIPLIGPLHISLNAKEDITINYHSLFKYFCERLFPKAN